MSRDGSGKKLRRGEGQWRGLLARFDASGGSVAAFCRREAISTASFYRWRARLGASEGYGRPVRKDDTPMFVDAGTLGGTFSAGSRLDLKLDLGQGLVLHLVRG
jgi:putative transposase